MIGHCNTAAVRMFAVLLLSIGLAQATAHAATYALSVSSSSSRSGAIALQGATLSGNAYIFTSLASQLTNFNPSGIAGVCFWLDNTAMSGTANHCESYLPYDFGSTGDTSNSTANPWNTTSIGNGTHTMTQKVTLSAGGSEVDTASFTVQNGTQSGSVYALSVSSSTNHSGAVALQGTTLAGGSVYIFTSLASQLTNFYPSGVSAVCFWLDNISMSGTANHCESLAPYDFAGSVDSSSTSLANPWDTTQLPSGTHTI